MSDLAKRLREAAKMPKEKIMVDVALNEAADEIEKLRAACQLMIDGKWDRACKAARAALSKGEQT